MYIKHFVKGLGLLGLNYINPFPFIFSNPLLLSLSSLSHMCPSIASGQCATVCTRRPQCMTLDQSEAAIPKVYLLWLEPGNWRGIKHKRPQITVHSERRHTQLVRDIICLKPVPLTRKAPPPKGKKNLSSKLKVKATYAELKAKSFVVWTSRWLRNCYSTVFISSEAWATRFFCPVMSC